MSHDTRSPGMAEVLHGGAGVTMLEILVVAALSSCVLWAATMALTWSNRSFKRTTDLVNSQYTLDIILDTLRQDVLRLRSCTPGKDGRRFSFLARRSDWDVCIDYVFSPETSTVTRTERIGTGQPAIRTFQGGAAVDSLSFHPVCAVDGTFTHLDVSLRVRSDERGGGAPTRVAVLCRMFSRCTQGYFPFAMDGGQAP